MSNLYIDISQTERRIIDLLVYCLKNKLGRCAWVAQLTERPTLDFGTGHGLVVRGVEPCVGPCAEHGACLRFFLSPSAPLLLCMLSLSLKKEL